MNVFELAFFSVLLGLIYLLSGWLSGLMGVRRLILLPLLVLAVLAGLEIVGRRRGRRGKDSSERGK